MEVTVGVGFRLANKWCLSQLHGRKPWQPNWGTKDPHPAVQARKIHMLEPCCAPDFVLGSVPENMHATSTSCAVEKAKLGSILQVTKSGTWNQIWLCLRLKLVLSTNLHFPRKLRLALQHRNGTSLNLCSFVSPTPLSLVDKVRVRDNYLWVADLKMNSQDLALW